MSLFFNDTRHGTEFDLCEFLLNALYDHFFLSFFFASISFPSKIK